MTDGLKIALLLSLIVWAVGAGIVFLIIAMVGAF